MSEVLFIAGEASGDLHAAGVAEELARLRPELKMTGIGGPKMQAAGVELIARYENVRDGIRRDPDASSATFRAAGTDAEKARGMDESTCWSSWIIPDST